MCVFQLLNMTSVNRRFSKSKNVIASFLLSVGEGSGAYAWLTNFQAPLRPPYGSNNPQEMTNNILKSNVDPQMHALTLKI